MSDRLEEKNPISRRKFIQIGGALTAGSTLSAGLTNANNIEDLFRKLKIFCD